MRPRPHRFRRPAPDGKDPSARKAAPPAEEDGSLWAYLRGGALRREEARHAFEWAAPHHKRLSKAHPTDWLTHHGTTGGTLRVNLTWSMHTGPSGDGPTGLLRGLFAPLGASVQVHGPAVVSADLDLACLYELTDGTKGVVQPLGGFHGDLYRPPYISLSADSRFGGPMGETLYINLDKRDEFRRMLVFVYNYDCTPVFGRVDSVLTFYLPDGHQFAVELRERVPQARSCAVALIENRQGHLTVRREATYVYGFQSDLDRLYGWGMRWARGHKRP
ncbi:MULTISPECIES: Tellurium resistance [Streptomyces]|uniref:Tellurium resistance n=1 Tax=Streptomyces TaxID=1883 RepID=UPI00163BB6AB|nr:MULTISPECIES: Tellurium resistance [Streptomyces]MBC2874436.1 Tellurium resistance [Streptomyces sp. TYQ1024]UBI40462.1 Tellurium resistance [Streptomyces mobaraensis]UKW33044.1 Tellurium resistance [Streptomyces sp. TYQ1024]